MVSNTDVFQVKEFSQELQGLIRSSNIIQIPLRSMKEEADDDPSHYAFVPPFNVTQEERIAWFKKKLPLLDIFKPNNFTLRFHSRVSEFFNHTCEAQFFMTWIAPSGSFGKRDFLSTETIFKAHPNGCLIIISKTMDSHRGYRILKRLVDRGFKVTAVTPDFDFLLNNTPAAAWYEQMKRGNKDPGEIPLAQNLSNLIRLAVLYRYGGTYLDTDFIVVKRLSGLRNSIGVQSVDVKSKNWTRLNNAVLIFEKNHPLLLKLIEEFASSFNGNKWGHNGPYLFSRVVERLQGRPGYDLTILPPSAFYPVSWARISGFFKKAKSQADSRWVEAKQLQLRGETNGVHPWNKLSRRQRIEEGSIMGRLISNHCVICENIYAS